MGALSSHRADIFYNVERAASYVSRILNGANRGDLPIQQPARYEVIVNLKAPAALGLEMPPEILAQATRAIR